jgi:hypothetical protein
MVARVRGGRVVTPKPDRRRKAASPLDHVIYVRVTADQARMVASRGGAAYVRRLIMAAAFLVSPLGCGGSVEATPEPPCEALYVPCALAAGELSVYCAPVAPVCLSAIPAIGDVMIVGCLDRDGRCQCSRSTVADGPSLECGAQ